MLVLSWHSLWGSLGTAVSTEIMNQKVSIGSAIDGVGTNARTHMKASKQRSLETMVAMKPTHPGEHVPSTPRHPLADGSAGFFGPSI